MLESTWAFIVFCIVFIILASNGAENLASIVAPIHDWFNKKYGFPRNVKTGKEGMIKKTATVITQFKEDPDSGDMLGQVSVHGEIWRARISKASKQKFEVGDTVVITGVDGLTLDVKSFTEQVLPG